MCTLHNQSDISRRGFATLVLAGASLGLLSLPVRAAGHTAALCIMCIDYRLVNGEVGFFNTQPWLPRTGDYDVTALAGASLAGVLTKFPEAVPGFWKQIELARQLHAIENVVVLDHMQCGAYEQQFNGGKPFERKEPFWDGPEYPFHVSTMKQVNAAFGDRFGASMKLSFFIMDVVDDKPGRIISVPV
jgi:hypothetical protein